MSHLGGLVRRIDMRASQEPAASPERRGPTAASAPVKALPSRGDDAELVVRAQRGDRWAGEALYRRHAPDVFRVTTLLLGRTADVDDVVQDAFVKALRTLSTLREPASFGGWVVRIAANLARSRLRRRALLRRLGLDRGDEDASFEELAAETLGPDQRLELARVAEVLRRLPTDDRIAWTLRRVEGWPLQEIGDAVGSSLATVKRRISAADQELRAHLGRAVGEEP